MSRFGIVPNPEHQAKNRSGRKTGQKRFSGQNKKRWTRETQFFFYLSLAVILWVSSLLLAALTTVHMAVPLMITVLSVPPYFRSMYLIARKSHDV